MVQQPYNKIDPRAGQKVSFQDRHVSHPFLSTHIAEHIVKPARSSTNSTTAATTTIIPWAFCIIETDYHWHKDY